MKSFLFYFLAPVVLLISAENFNHIKPFWGMVLASMLWVLFYNFTLDRYIARELKTSKILAWTLVDVLKSFTKGNSKDQCCSFLDSNGWGCQILEGHSVAHYCVNPVEPDLDCSITLKKKTDS